MDAATEVDAVTCRCEGEPDMGGRQGHGASGGYGAQLPCLGKDPMYHESRSFEDSVHAKG
ncbi:MAG: hypothetical protein ABGY24_01495 [bacterium]